MQDTDIAVPLCIEAGGVNQTILVGLNEKLLSDYVEWIAAKRMKAIDVATHDLSKYVTSNPLPWTQKWISGAEIQVAPQETEITSYITGGINKDVDENTFKGFTL